MFEDHLEQLGFFKYPIASLYFLSKLAIRSGWLYLRPGVWSSPEITGERPPPCAGFSFTKVDQHRAVLFGGKLPNGSRANSAYLFNFMNMEITKVEPVQGEPWPVGRARHAACCLNYGEEHPKLLVSGGLESEKKLLGDMWILDVDTGKWTKLEVPTSLKPRYWHSMTATSLGPGCTEAVMFGGSQKVEGSPVAETVILRFDLTVLLPSVAGPSIGKWALAEVAYNITRGSRQLQRLREKMAITQEAPDTLSAQESSNQSLSNSYQEPVTAQEGEEQEHVTQSLFEAADHEAEQHTVESTAVRRNQKLMAENAQLQGELQRMERRAQLAEEREQATQRLLDEANYHRQDAKRQLSESERRLKRNFKAQQTSQEAEQCAVEAERRNQELTADNHQLQGNLQEMERRAQLAEQRATEALTRQEATQHELTEALTRQEAAQHELTEALTQQEATQHELTEALTRWEATQHELTEALTLQGAIQHELEGKTRELAAHNTEVWRIPSHRVHTVRSIGTGGWGEVLEGTVRVAMKRMHPAIVNQRNLERLQREVRFLAEVCHSNLVQFIGAVLDQSPPLIITELLDMNLRQAYEQNQLRPENRLSIFKDIARALDYLHQRYEPIIHRDVSAPNVLLQRMPNNQWKGKVSDLGSANFLQDAQTMGEGAIVYSPPEMIPQPVALTTEPPPQTVKIDVYSYGIVACEVTVSRFPSQENFSAMIRQVQRDQPRLHELILACTKRDPSDRLSMAEVLLELEKLPSF